MPWKAWAVISGRELVAVRFWEDQVREVAILPGERIAEVEIREIPSLAGATKDLKEAKPHPGEERK